MAEDRSDTSQDDEQTEEQTESSETIDDLVKTVEHLKQSVDKLDTDSSIDGVGNPIKRRHREAEKIIGRSERPELGLSNNSRDAIVGVNPTPSNQQLENRLNRQGRRLKKVENRLENVVDALDGLVEHLASNEQRPVGEVLQDVLDDEITQRRAAAELGWSQSKVSQVVNQIDE